MRVVAEQFEVVVAEVEDVLTAVLYGHHRQGPGVAFELLAQRFDVVAVDVHVAAGPDELAGPQLAARRLGPA